MWPAKAFYADPQIYRNFHEFNLLGLGWRTCRTEEPKTIEAIIERAATQFLV